MNNNEVNTKQNGLTTPEALSELHTTELPRPQPPAIPTDPPEEMNPDVTSQATEPEAHEEPESKLGLDRKKMMMLGGGLAAALVFFALTMIIGKSSEKRPASSHRPEKQAQTQPDAKTLSGVTPIMTALRKPDAASNDGRLSPEDIKRMRAPDSPNSTAPPKRAAPSSTTPTGNNSLASVPSFSDTQQRWEEPPPYRTESNGKPAIAGEQQAALKETSLAFVRSQSQPSANSKASNSLDADEPLLDVTPGSRILAKLQEEISTADNTPVIAQVEYTYAIGDEVVVPAGALIYGHLQQADSSGYVSVKFEEIEFLDHRRQRIDAVGKDLDMGPIKGKVTGQNTGKNLLVRSVSGIGSTLAMVFGNNTSSAFSEDDLIRERLAENIGTAGDSEIMNMVLNSREVVSVPAERHIYVVLTKHEDSPSTLHRVNQ